MARGFSRLILPGPVPILILLAPARRAGRGAREHALFWKVLEGGRGESGGAWREQYKGVQDARSGSSCVFLVGLELVSSWFFFFVVAARSSSVFLVSSRARELMVAARELVGVCKRLGFFVVAARLLRSTRTRDTDGRRRFASSVAQACASVWRAPERARPPSHHEGAGNRQRSRGIRSVCQVPRHKGPRALSDPSVYGGGLFLFFCFRMNVGGAVSCK